MDATKLVSKLVEKFGSDVVRSAYHVQILSNKGPHDIWINKFNEIKFKLVGNRNSKDNVSIDFIIQSVQSTQKSHFDKMREMLDLAKFVNECEQRARGEIAIFTDAGFKGGNARIAAVFVNGDNIEAKSQLIEAVNNSIAEFSAIKLGLSMHSAAPVYNDNQSIVLTMQNERVKWLSRTQNKAADQIGNMRQ